MTDWPIIHIRKTLPTEGDPQKSDQFTVIEDFRYLHPLVGERIVRAGFVSDGLSVPQVFWGMIPPHGRGFNAAVIHDDCYIHSVGAAAWGGTLARVVADYLFRLHCTQSRLPRWEVWLVWAVVRLGGSGKWRKYQRENKKRLLT